MKPQLTFAFLLLFFTATLSAQVEFKVKLLPDNSTYQVVFKSNTTWSPPFNATSSSQVTVRVPTGGFAVGTINSTLGTWALDSNVEAPVENPGFDYLIFGLQGATNNITYTEGEEVAVFEFTNSGTCTGAVELIENDVDPFFTNTMSLGINNTLLVIGAGIGQNAYQGNYGAIPADCTPTSSCGIQVTDLELIPPSACGVADGMIIIHATNSGGLPLQYRIDDIGAFQSSNIFDGLAAGSEFEITVRDVAAICSVELGTFELPGPLAAIPNGQDLVNPDCGMDNGSITLFATPQIPGNTIEFGIGTPPVYQASNVFNDLAQGSYQFWVRDVNNGCENFFGSYVLSGCAEPSCVLTYNLEDLGNGLYQVSMLSDTTWNFPSNITSSMMVTIKVPTGGFDFGNLTSQVTGVNWAVGSTYEAPTEEPNYDYISINMNSPGTQNIVYAQGNSQPLFTFENIGTCEGDSIFLMAENDPFSANTTANVGQQAFTSGAGEDIVPCLGTNAAVCLAPPASCLITYELEKTGPNTFEISMIPDVTWGPPFNTTSSLQVTIKVPTGGFDLANLTNLLPNSVNWSEGSMYPSPPEEPGFDYLTITLGSPGTQNITYQTGVKLPLFSFENGGECVGADVILMDNATDPFFPPNSQNANVGQQLFTAGSGEDVQACVINNPAEDCNEDPCVGFTASFTAPDGCEGETIDFTNTTTSTETMISWDWEFGDTPAGTSDQENPSYTYSNSGNFEVSLTVTTESGCMATSSDFVTVFPSPGAPTVTEYLDCNGAGVQLEAPAADMVSWSPTTGLDNPNISNPFANPTETTAYTVTLTSADGCTSATVVDVIIAEKPVFKDVTPTQASECGVQDASIQISAVGVGNIEFSINGINGPYVTDSLFTNLAAGSYDIFIRNADGTCPVAFNGNSVVIEDLLAPVIDNVNTVDPTGCNPDGSITVIASSGTGVLMYSLSGAATQGPQVSNTFANLMEGNYTVTVTNENGSCAQTQDVALVGTGNNLTIQTPVPDQDLCVTGDLSVSITLNEDIASFDITSGSFANAVANGNTLTFDATAAMGANSFNVNFTSVSGCTASEAFTLTGVAESAPDFNTTSALCANGNITLNYTGAGNGQITWDIADATIANGDLNSTPIVINFATAGQKQICVTMDDNGCQVNDCQTLTIADFNPGASFATTDPACGANNGEINLTTNGNYTYLWTGNGVVPGDEDQANLMGGTYTVVISDAGGCSTQEQVQLNATQSITVLTPVSTPSSDCVGSSSGSITTQVTGSSGDLLYELFENGNPVAVDSETTVATEYTFQNVGAGAYTVVVTSVNGGCTDEAMVAVQSESTTLSATSTSEDSECGLTNGILNVEISGGVAPYRYDIYFSGVLFGTDIPVTGTTIENSNLAPAAITLIIYDALDCLVPVTEVIGSEPADLSGITSSVDEATCGGDDGCINLSGVPADATVSWVNKADPLTQIGAGSDICDLSPGLYTAQFLLSSGCLGEMDFTVNASDGAEITIVDSTDATCGNNDGSLTFIVNGGGDFSYEILGTLNSGFGTPGANITVTGLSTGAYVIEITDLVNNDCQAFEAFETGGGFPSSTTIVATAIPGSECGNADGFINISISGGVGPFTLESDQGVVPSGPFIGDATITGIYDGNVNVLVTDEGVGCSNEITYELGEIEEANAGDFTAVTDLVCADDFGSIVANTNGTFFEVFDDNGDTVGSTPLMNLPAGVYTIQHTLGLCIDEVDVTITAPDAWSVVEAVSLESCNGLDGSIILEVNGANGGYEYLWSNAATSEDLTGLSAGMYTLTITDAMDCTYEASFEVDTDCPTGCDEIFLVDTFIVALQGDRTEICLPTEYADMNIFDLSLNNTTYGDLLEVCPEFTNFYGYGMLLNLGNPPYELVEWTYRGTKVTDFQFNEIEDLVNYMNQLDPYGNWALDVAESSISGGAPGSDYGSLILSHVSSMTTLTLQVNTVSVDHPSIFVDEAPFHVFIAQDPSNPDCADTLYISVADQTPDTIMVVVPIGETIYPDCLEAPNLPGSLESLNNICQSANSYAQLISTGDLCVGYQGISVGTDYFCMEICDDLGNCITVPVIVEVTDGGEFQIFNAFSPNEDGINDYFKIRGIERYPNNQLTVFNRWGNRVYSKKGYTNSDPFMGTYKNTLLSSGTFFYILEVEMDGKMEIFSGYVELRR